MRGRLEMNKVRGLRWYILVLVMLGTVVNYIDRNTLGVLAPTLTKELNFSTEQYSYIVAAFQISYSLMQPIAGIHHRLHRAPIGVLRLRPDLGIGVRPPRPRGQLA